MILSVVLIIWFVAAVITITRPRFGLVFMWFSIWLYPNTALYGTLPLNVRFDNLWVVFVMLVALVTPQSRRRIDPAVLVSLAWFGSIILGSVTGLLIQTTAWQTVVKDILRNLYIPFTAYAICNLIHTDRHIERYLSWTAIAASCAALLGAATVYYPAAVEVFVLPTYQESVRATAFELIQATEVQSRRGGGAFDAIAQAILMQQMAALTLAMMIWHPRPIWRVFYGAACALCVFGLLCTITRGAIAGLAVALCLAIALVRRRGTIITVIVLGAVGLIVEGSQIERLMTRLTGEGATYGTTLLEGIVGRLEIAQHFLQDFSAIHMFSGVGFTNAKDLYGGTVHNAYLGAFIYGGIVGVIVVVVAVYLGISLCRRAMRHREDWLAQALATYLLLSLTALLVYGFAAEVFQFTFAMHVYFAGLALTHRRLSQLQSALPIQQTPVALPPATPVIMPGPYVAGR